MDWSLILPSRERPGQLKKLLQSLADTTLRPEVIEVIVSVDSDDAITLDQIEGMNAKFEFVKWNVGPRRDNFSIYYFNEPAIASRGRFIQALNDDVVFVTRGWDRLGMEAFDEAGWSEAYGKCSDTLGAVFACFPVLTRNMLEVLTWMFHPEFPTLGADVNLHKIMSLAGRVVSLPYHLDHSRHQSTPVNDTVHQRVERLATYNWQCHYGEADRVRKALSRRS